MFQLTSSKRSSKVAWEELGDSILSDITFDEKGLVPAVVQDVKSRKVLMLAYMNRESIQKTLEEGVVYYYSRSRQTLWKKGETSGNIQYLKGLYLDCDKDSLLVLVEQVGAACHTGSFSCFFNPIFEIESRGAYPNLGADNLGTHNAFEELYKVVADRKSNPKEGSYTAYLLKEGLDKILKKIGEEASEVIIAAKGGDKEEIVHEISDLVYHLLVLMVSQNVTIGHIEQELISRRK